MSLARSARLMVAFASLAIFSAVVAAQDAAPAPAAAPAGPTKRVAVMNFDYGTVRTYVSQIFGSDQDVGKGISDMLVMKLVQDGKYRVIERAALDKILAEQNFSNSDRADATSAAKIGKILGVDAIIIGSITQFGRDDQHTQRRRWRVRFGPVWLGWRRHEQSKSGRRHHRAHHQHNHRRNYGGGYRNWRIHPVQHFACRCRRKRLERRWRRTGYGKQQFFQYHSGEATHKAVDDTAAQLDAGVDKVQTVKLEINGLVADVSGSTLIINVGKKSGVKVGDKLIVTRQVRTIKDPATGKVIKSVEDKVGEVTVTEADNDSATATFAGAGSAKVGDVVKNP